MNKEQFAHLIMNAGLCLVGVNDLRFAVVLRLGSSGYQRGMFEFEPDKFRAMTEEDSKVYIRRCKMSMQREAQKSSAYDGV
jgi:hypothetical protein